jgi:hypothetical protein
MCEVAAEVFWKEVTERSASQDMNASQDGYDVEDKYNNGFFRQDVDDNDYTGTKPFDCSPEYPLQRQKGCS